VAQHVTEAETPYYTEARIRRILREWPCARSLAESWVTSAHCLSHGPDDDGRPCQNAPSGGRHNKRASFDPNKGSDIVADLERAHARLRYGSLEWTIVDRLMRHGPLGMRELRAMIGRDQNAVTEAFRSAVKQMSDWLEGVQ